MPRSSHVNKNLLWYSIGVGPFAIRHRRLKTLPLFLFPVAIKIRRACYHCVPLHFHFINIQCTFLHPFHVHRLDLAEILLLWRLTPTINESIDNLEISPCLVFKQTYTHCFAATLVTIFVDGSEIMSSNNC